MAENDIYLSARAKQSNMAPQQSSIPKLSRASLGVATSSTINSAMPPPMTVVSHGSFGGSKGNPVSSISRPKSSLDHTSRLPSRARSRSSSNVKQISMNSYSSNIVHSGGIDDDMNKSLSMAQDIISLQKQREHDLVNQVMRLQNEKTQLELSKAKLQQTISDQEKSSHIKDLKINELEYSAQLSEEKLINANELRIRDLNHQHEENISKLQDQYRTELESELNRCKAKYKESWSEQHDLLKNGFLEKERNLTSMIKEERTANQTKIQELVTRQKQDSAALEIQKTSFEKEVDKLEKEKNDFKLKYEFVTSEMELAKGNLSKCQTETETRFHSYQAQIQSLEMKLSQKHMTMGDLEKAFEEIQEKNSIAQEKLLRAETARRKLHNQLQELKGNIRVYCRVRPLLLDEDGPVKLNFPDCDEECQQLQLAVPSIGGIPSLDQESQNRIHSFTFDKVFNPTASNEDVFDDVSQLVQSALDGYNVCIFAYGQTGSGKTYTMSSASNGIIPLAINQIFETAEALKETGWEYEYSGEFLEIYNEKIVDLLGKSDDIDKGKYEIRHDTLNKKTIVTGLTTVKLESPKQAAYILQKASRNRSVAATMANERSSRSHSVFILRLTGRNKINGKTHNGVLNLIDLAGSERLSHSQAAGDRLKETQAINKSLSSLGDVICALGSAKDGSHVPYRNSKLTYLLQYSLSGNSKTLMLVNVSPLQLHANETINSLRFATKVNNTHIGTAKRLT